MRRTEADEAAIARLHTMLDAERAARQEAVAAAQHDAAEAASAIAGAPLVRAGRFNLTLSGFTQVDVTAWNQLSQDQLNPATGAPLNQTRFNIRRARLRAEVDWRMIGGAVEFDGNTNNGYQARIIGAEVSLKWKNKRDAAGAGVSGAHRRQLQDPVRLRGAAERRRSPVPRALEHGARLLLGRVRSRRASCSAAGASSATRSPS